MSADRRDLDSRGAALALLVSVFWGANPVAIKLALLDMPPLRLATFRFVLGGLVILGWAWLTGRLRGLRVERHEWRPLITLGLLLGVQIGSLNIGTAMTSASHSAVLLNLYAVHLVVLSHFLIPGDRLTPRRFAGVVVAYSGIALLTVRQATTAASTLVGDAIVFASAFILAERTVYLARKVHDLDPVKMLLAQAVIGVLIFLACSAIVERGSSAWTPRLALAIAYQGIVIAGFNFILNLWLLKRYRPSALAPLFLTQPLFGVVAAALIVGDPLTIDLLVATIAVAIGVGLASR